MSLAHIYTELSNKGDVCSVLCCMLCHFNLEKQNFYLKLQTLLND